MATTGILYVFVVALALGCIIFTYLCIVKFRRGSGAVHGPSGPTGASGGTGGTGATGATKVKRMTTLSAAQRKYVYMLDDNEADVASSHGLVTALDVHQHPTVLVWRSRPNNTSFWMWKGAAPYRRTNVFARTTLSMPPLKEALLSSHAQLLHGLSDDGRTVVTCKLPTHAQETWQCTMTAANTVLDSLVDASGQGALYHYGVAAHHGKTWLEAQPMQMKTESLTVSPAWLQTTEDGTTTQLERVRCIALPDVSRLLWTYLVVSTTKYQTRTNIRLYSSLYDVAAKQWRHHGQPLLPEEENVTEYSLLYEASKHTLCLAYIKASADHHLYYLRSTTHGASWYAPTAGALIPQHTAQVRLLKGTDDISLLYLDQESDTWYITRSKDGGVRFHPIAEPIKDTNEHSLLQMEMAATNVLAIGTDRHGELWLAHVHEC